MTDVPASKVEVVLQEGSRFKATNASGATTIMDTGGSDSGLTPMEHLLAGLAGCTAIDVISILRKKRLQVLDYRVEVAGVRAEKHPRIYTDIEVRHIVTGPDIPEEAVRSSIELSEKKYCSAYAMLSGAARISSTFEVRPAPVTDAVPG